jgi:hypothetical protein
MNPDLKHEGREQAWTQAIPGIVLDSLPQNEPMPPSKPSETQSPG